MNGLERFAVEKLVREYQLTHFISTRGDDGAMSTAARAAGFSRVITGSDAVDRTSDSVSDGRQPCPDLDCDRAGGDVLGILQLMEVQEALASHRCLFFLNAHAPLSIEGESGYAATPIQQRWPVLAALDFLRDRAANAIVVIDAISRYRPDFAVGHGRLPCDMDGVSECAFLEFVQDLQGTHSVHWHGEEFGYAVLWPLEWGPYEFVKWVRAGDENNGQLLQPGVPGTTCISLNRRVQDARYGNRWLVGKGLDIGGGCDTIGWYRRLFPRIENVTVYDLQQGDAQYLENVPDEEFDFVYSAHCLEHVADPCVAIRHWLRVLRNGGHLVLTVPDEDMYEQGIWPSTFNPDHRHTFTVFKRRSWSPVSVNVVELLQVFDMEVSIERIERLTQCFLPGYVRFDQTRTAFAECGIEIVVRKEGAESTR